MTSDTASARNIGIDVAQLLRPPRRIRVSEAGAEMMKVTDGAGQVLPWNPDTAPYMAEPMDCLASRAYDAVIFVGPARTGKTQSLVDGFVTYVVTCDPGDMLIVHTSQEDAREFSKKRIERLLSNSPDLAACISPRGHDNNVHDRVFRAGNYLGIKWPTKNVLAGSDYRYVVITDYDRIDDDIGGEGSAFSQASKRTQTFMSAGMCAVESSPGKPVLDPDWQCPKDQLHMAPPTKGILALYNLGDRRRLYWQCLHCGDWFQPTLENWHQPTRRPVCPHCGGQPRPKHKKLLNRDHRWLWEGGHLDADGNRSGPRRDTRIASFWMEGPAAAYQMWDALGRKLEQNEETFQATGSQEGLKSHYGLDWGRPYIDRHAGKTRSAARLADRADSITRRRVPRGVRFLTAAVDVQGGREARFVVQVHGWGRDGECWVVDRFNIREDRGPDGKSEPRAIDPATNPEDWDLLTRDLLPRTYTLDDGSGREMPIVMIAVDSGGSGGRGGAVGVTKNAYAWYRRLRRSGHHRQVWLVKGATHRQQARIRTTYPDSGARKDRKAGSKGDVPLLMLSTDQLKDSVAAMLDRQEPGPGFLHTPDWLGRWWYDELTAEDRGPDGRWTNERKRPNEAFDLAAYNYVAYIQAGGEKIDWTDPPPWARDWDENSLLSAEAAEALLNTRRRRRVSRSSYVTR